MIHVFWYGLHFILFTVPLRDREAFFTVLHPFNFAWLYRSRFSCKWGKYKNDTNKTRNKRKRLCLFRIDFLDFLSITDLGDSFELSGRKTDLKNMRAELDQMLKQRLTPHSFSGKYLTQSGKLELPANEGQQFLSPLRAPHRTSSFSSTYSYYHLYVQENNKFLKRFFFFFFLNNDINCEAFIPFHSFASSHLNWTLWKQWGHIFFMFILSVDIIL